jgi:hypothetical protein
MIAASIAFSATVMLLTTTIVAALSPCNETDRLCTHPEIPADHDIRNW